ncbi:hypothetical protein ACFYXM_34090 [Streptomyces sp. NPDC002476]|uniref:hypothetical protein n=1 Tax=Streptomyces sp. NPDC002476 TaxID=3364648 RepID=UPI00368A4C91
MSTHLPDRIIIDLEEEGEFLTGDQPGPTRDGHTTDRPGNGPGKSDSQGGTRPGTGSRLATGLLTLARREAAAIRTGAGVLAAERAAWLNASAETPAHLRAAFLNHRYSTWVSRKDSEVQRLEEKAAALDKRATGLDRQAEQMLTTAPADPEGTAKRADGLRKEAARLRKEAAGWRKQAREAQQRPYTGHQEPGESELKRHRGRTARRRWAATAALGLAIGWAELRIGGMLPALTATGATTIAWAKGRFGWRRELPEVPPLAYELDTGSGSGTTGMDQTPPAGQDSAAAADLKPFPVRDVTTVGQAEEALRRAILHEGGDVETVTDGKQEPWGWSARVSFKTGSPDDLNETQTYRNLITLLKLRRNGLLVEADPDHGDTCTVRMVLTDPFTPELVGPAPYRAPLSASIVDTFDFGVAMDADPLTFCLAGLMLLMVADSGGGKSGVMLALAEAVTSTRDAVVLNLDPVGTGVGDLGPAITLNACMDDDLIIAVLEFLLTWCSARARQRAANGWGNKWKVSPEHPAICVFVDEWPQLSPTAKALLIKLLLLGRKEAIWVYGGSQYGTKDYLGEAIGPKLAAKLLGSCRRVDVTELLGGGSVTEGYRADLLRPATHTAKNDAGQIYGVGLPGMPNRPVRYQVREIAAEQAARLGAERAAAGLPDLTHTLTEAGLLDAWNQLLDTCNAAAGTGTRTPAEAPGILRTLREAFVRESEPEYLTIGQIHDHLRSHDPERWGQWDEKEDRIRLGLVARNVSKELADVGIELESIRLSDVRGKPTVYRLEDVEEALAAFG